MSDLAAVNEAARSQLALSEEAIRIQQMQADQVIGNAARLVAISGTETLQKKVANWLWPFPSPQGPDVVTTPSDQS